MTAAPATKLLTADEFDLLDEPEEGGKLELVQGRIVKMAPVSGDHGTLQGELYTHLRGFVRRHRLGRVFVETSFRLVDRPGEPHETRAPDVSFVAAARLPSPPVLSRASLPLVPDLAVEVTSPSDRDTRLHQKVELYLAAGVGRVWIVRPGLRTVAVHRPDGTARTYRPGDTLTSDDAGFAVEGFALPLAELFE